MTSSKKPYAYRNYDVTHKKLKSKTFQFFFNLSYKTFLIFKAFEQLSSSICWRVMTFSQNTYLLWDLIFYQNLGFGAIILAPDALESQSRAPKTGISAQSQ